MRHDLLTLELLQAVARTQSIPRGAEQVQLAIAAASKRISELEVRLGLRLFVRRPRGMESTAACRSLLKHVSNIRTALQALDREAFEISQGVAGILRIAVCGETAIEGLPQHLAEFLQKHPRIKIQVARHGSEAVADSLIRGDADLGIFLAPTVDARIQTWPYAQGRWELLFPRSHPLSGNRRITVKELLEFNLVGVRREPLSGHLNGAAASLGLPLHSPLDATSDDAIAALVGANAGVGLVTDAWAARLAIGHGLERAPLDEPWAHYELVLGVARAEPISMAARALLEALRASASSALPRRQSS